MKLTNAMAWAAAAMVVLGAGGCKSAHPVDDRAANAEFKKKHDTDIFRQDQGPERVSRFTEIQSANGARHDAMLYPVHFTGEHLNSLGRSKVMLMVADAESDEPVTVHLVNCGQGEMLAQRKASVELYVKATEGPNALTFHPTAPELVRFDKTESGSLSDRSAAAQAGEGVATVPSMNPQK
jgi:hypothetical protein